MTKAEERALEAYPVVNTWSPYGPLPVDQNKLSREKYQEGYEQAEKDLALTWEDMREIIRIDEEMMDDPEAHPEWMEEQPFYEEMLRRFKEARK